MPGVHTSPLAAVIAQRAKQQAERYAQQAAQTAQAKQPAPAAAPVLVTPATPSPLDDQRQWAKICLDASARARNSFVEMAYYGYRLRQAGNWTALGFDSEDHFRQNLGVSARAWDRKFMTLGARISHLPLESLSTLTIAKAEQLALIHPRVWPEFAWLDEARLLTPEEFRSLVIERNRDATLLADPISVVEPKVKFTIPMPQSQQKDLERRLVRLRRAGGHSSAAATLESAIDAAEHAESLADLLAEVSQSARELAALWDSIAETPEERAARYDSGPSDHSTTLLAAAARTRSLAGRLARSVRQVNSTIIPGGSPSVIPHPRTESPAPAPQIPPSALGDTPAA